LGQTSNPGLRCRRTARNADCQSAVSPVENRRRARPFHRLADYQSATQQAASLRYGASDRNDRKRRSADCQSAVSPVVNRRAVRHFHRLADYQSAIQQAASLRYDASDRNARKRRSADC